jgi:hypothetical protein
MALAPYQMQMISVSEDTERGKHKSHFKQKLILGMFKDPASGIGVHGPNAHYTSLSTFLYL